MILGARAVAVVVLAMAVGASGVVAGCGGGARSTRSTRPARPARPAAATPARLAKRPGATQEGLATWYGGKFHGRRTASGERFDQNAMTAAHRTLPFGAKIRVTNQKNGRAVVLRVNDRGPFGGKRRVIDVSRAAAQKLDMIQDGVVPVRVEVLWIP